MLLRGKAYLCIWPLAYEIRKNEGQVVVAGKDTEGRFYIEGAPTYVFIGDKVTVRGSEVTANSMKQYIWYSLPENWKGPFWIVTEIENAG